MDNFANNNNINFYYRNDMEVDQFGYGIGLKYTTILGPLEIIVSRGDRINYTTNTSDKKNVAYFRFGYYLH